MELFGVASSSRLTTLAALPCSVSVRVVTEVGLRVTPAIDVLVGDIDVAGEQGRCRLPVLASLRVVKVPPVTPKEWGFWPVPPSKKTGRFEDAAGVVEGQRGVGIQGRS